jgi:sugar (pentulose or hexulose) kinase
VHPTITVDIGTTSVKLCLFDEEARLIASARQPTPVRTDGVGEIYDIDELTGLIAGFISRLEAWQRALVRRVAITGVGESGGLVRPDLRLASPMILWHDHRGAAYLDALTPEQRSRIYEITGLPVNANYGLSKIAWSLGRAEGSTPDTVWLNVAEYVAALMTGERFSEHTLASRVMALDLTTGRWSGEVCDLVGIPESVLPELRSADEGSVITAAFATLTGLSPDVVVHVAGHDHMVGGVGAELGDGELLNSTGTTEGLLFTCDAPFLTPAAERAKLANGIACGGEGFTLFASIPTGGSAFATLQSMLGLNSEQLTLQLDDLSEKYLAGEIDLKRIPLVLPQFRGAPPPTKNSAARGLIYGLRTDTERDEIVVGTFLGMALQYRDVLDLFPSTAQSVKVIGPASKNPLWLQIKADLLATPVSVSAFPEVVSRGAQALASQRSGDWAGTAPFDVRPDSGRTAQLHGWFDAIERQWDYAKGFPT